MNHPKTKGIVTFYSQDNKYYMRHNCEKFAAGLPYEQE